MSYGKSTYAGAFPNGFLGVLQGLWLNLAFEKVFQGGISREDSITAHAGGTKAAAYALTSSYNRVSVCATNNDSVLMPKAIAGSEVTVINAGAATLDVFSKGSDTIGANDAATATTIATTKAKTFVCVTAGHWDVVSAT